jgi:hypothetical protein
LSIRLECEHHRVRRVRQRKTARKVTSRNGDTKEDFGDRQNLNREMAIPNGKPNGISVKSKTNFEVRTNETC